MQSYITSTVAGPWLLCPSRDTRSDNKKTQFTKNNGGKKKETIHFACGSCVALPRSRNRTTRNPTSAFRATPRSTTWVQPRRRREQCRGLTCPCWRETHEGMKSIGETFSHFSMRTDISSGRGSDQDGFQAGGGQTGIQPFAKILILIRRVLSSLFIWRH